MLCRHLFRTICISNEFKHVQFGLHPHRLHVFLMKYGICSTYCLNLNIVTAERLQKSCVQNYYLRHKSHKSFVDDEKLSDMDSDEDEITLADIKNLPEDPDVPNGYKTKMVHSLRADQLVQKGLNISNMESEVIFYNSKFLYKWKTLLKKAKKLSEGEFVDILVEKSDVDQPTNSVTVRRVKVIKIFQQTTKKGKPKVAIRVWLKPFEVKR